MDVSNILNAINNTINNKLFVDLKLQKKITARSVQKYILKDCNNKKYLLEVATTPIQKFYLERSLELQKKFQNFNINYLLNLPLISNFGNQYSFVLYNYFESYQEVKEDISVETLVNFYKLNSEDIKISDESVDKILKNFISAWPNQFHSFINRTKEFQDYKKILLAMNSIKISFEHGDYTKNNILNIDNKFYLMDFEFCREFQPIGFDIYDYAISTNQLKIFQKEIKYIELHQLKYKLINKINQGIDNRTTDIQIYDNFEDEILVNEWNALFNKGANYNLAPIWCKTWCKYYLKQNELFIFTVWDDSKLVLLLPLYKKGQKLLVIGSEPDLYDNLDILYTSDRYITKFLEYVIKENLDIDFRYINSESAFAKLLIKYLYQNNITYDSKIIDAKPRTNLQEFKPKSKEKSDIVRLKNRAKNNYKTSLLFEYEAVKSKEAINEFINIHKERWDGGPFINLSHFENFIHDIAKTDLVLLSKLSLENKTVAYHFAYTDSYGYINSAIPSYSKIFDDISPGKTLLYDILEASKDKGIQVFDFGRGAEGYKYWFSNESSILFHIKTYKRNHFLNRIKILINKVFSKMERIIYG